MVPCAVLAFERSVDQALRGTVYDAAVGALKVTADGPEYFASPISAALRTVAGRRIEREFWHSEGIHRVHGGHDAATGELFAACWPMR